MLSYTPLEIYKRHCSERVPDWPPCLALKMAKRLFPLTDV